MDSQSLLQTNTYKWNKIWFRLRIERVALYIEPLFDFANTVWEGIEIRNITLMHELQVWQNEAAQVILEWPIYAS